jgi:hypothetical protein
MSIRDDESSPRGGGNLQVDVPSNLGISSRQTFHDLAMTVQLA